MTTLATIDPSSTPCTLPTTLGSASHNAVTVAIDSVLAIFSPDCQSVTPLQFECSIQTFAVSPCNRFGNAKTTIFQILHFFRFLLAGLSDGSMAFVSIDQRRLLTSVPLAPPSSLVASTFSGPTTSATMTLASSEGLHYVFTKVQLDKFHQALEEGDVAGLQAAQGSIERNVVEVDCKVAGAAHIPSFDNSLGVVLLTELGILRPSLSGDQDDMLPTEVLQHKPKKVSSGMD